METADPLLKSKDEFKHIIEKIRSDSAVGIDAQLTHAVIIEYLNNIEHRLKRLEERLKSE